MNQLTSHRLVYRDILPSDFDNIFSLYGCSETMKYITEGIPFSKQECQNKLQSFLAEVEQIKPLGIWAAEDKESKEFIAWFLLKKFPGVTHPGIGYCISKKFWSQAYASEGSECLVNYCKKNDIKTNTISAITSPENLPSIRVLSKLNFKYIEQFDYTSPMTNKIQITNLYELNI